MSALTVEEMARLWAELDHLPGIELAGLRVVVPFSDGSSFDGLVIGVDADGAIWIGGSEEIRGAAGDDYRPSLRWISREDAYVDLADASTRDRVARWIADRVGQDIGSMAPELYYDGRTWCLGADEEDGGTEFSGNPDHDATYVAALAEVDTNDRRTLPDPDGSWYRVARALALVAVHVGGAS
jgi:hypothetical protein